MMRTGAKTGAVESTSIGHELLIRLRRISNLLASASLGLRRVGSEFKARRDFQRVARTGESFKVLKVIVRHGCCSLAARPRCSDDSSLACSVISLDPGQNTPQALETDLNKKI